MEFGIKLPHSGALAGVDNIRRVALEAEDLGFDSVWVHDHVTYDTDWYVHRSSGLIEQCEGMEPHFYESLSTLTYVAGFTDRVKLGTAILVLPLRDPRVLARQAMTLQALSKGRLLLGVGIGDYRKDFQVMEIPYEDKNALTDEYLEVLTSVFKGGNVSYQGDTVSFENAAYFPKVPPIPILYGGGIMFNRKTGQPGLYEPALRRIARLCHGWVPEGNAGLLARGARMIREMARDYGREEVAFQTVGYVPMYLAEDSVAQQKARASLEIERHSFEEAMKESLIGSAATVSRVVETYQKAGVEALGLRCWAEDIDGFIAMMRTFARDVMPSFR
ncbi:MAG: LLM class flavin-dependent oxidoreductase [Chloroflexi bacterium]|nr:LLM class flavin-dependent oxidoreductase [Chloroflexota bacterium]